MEFNARLGDPEAAVLLMRMESDLLELLLAATEGRLDDVQLRWDRRYALGVVMAAHGYPLQPRRGDVISGLPKPRDEGQCVVFHAGTSAQDDQTVTSGGRVLCVTALGDTVRQAQQIAYAELERIRFDGAQWRRDIGHRALKA